jgi:hypothetical protein
LLPAAEFRAVARMSLAPNLGGSRARG